MMQGCGFVNLPSLLHHPYLVCTLFGMPSLHPFTFLMFLSLCTFQSSTNLTLAKLTNLYTATVTLLLSFILLLLPSFSSPPRPLPLLSIFFHSSPTVLEDEEPVMVLSNTSSSPRLTQRPISLDSASGDELTSGSASGERRSQNGGECI